MKKKAIFVCFVALLFCLTAFKASALPPGNLLKNKFSTCDNEDPDGPWKGGMDDLSDEQYAESAAYMLGIEIASVWVIFRLDGTLFQKINGVIAITSITSVMGILCLLEAFDIINWNPFDS
jgi:hypothetical protein